MEPSDIAKLRELALLLDLAYLHHFMDSTRTGAGYKSAEATVRLEFGNFWYRKKNPTERTFGPAIEQVVVYSSVFSAARVSYFDSIDDAVCAAQDWYEGAKKIQD
ncbi:hypothetical protein [Demequina aurantiaca]|uniref:hypothetical protein n=1 Tax=Demequina aurantiaca TaxID=676200 RepID=UPI003D345372